MTPAVTVGLFIAGTSLVHRVPATAKLVALFVVGVFVFALDQWPPLTALALIALVLFRVAGLPWPAVLRQLRVSLLLIAIVGIAHGLAGSWSLGVVVVLRFAIVLSLATLIALTTRHSDMLAAFERGLRPLDRVGANSERIAFVLALTIRLIPLLAAHVTAIREAQRARGLDRSIVALAIPLLIRGLRSADALSEAIEARGGLAD